MRLSRLAGITLGGGMCLVLAACGGGKARQEAQTSDKPTLAATAEIRERRGTTLRSLFMNNADPNTTVEVNKYLWQASLEVLDFLPIESVDPFTGVIVTGYGVPPGGGRAYRATIYVQDPALEARSLKVALQGRGGGPVAIETVRAVEDAILTRARQLRVRDSRL